MVVLADENGGQLPQCGNIERLEELSLVGGTIAV
jgi:hypothetical protein